MRAAVITRPGGPEVLVVEERPRPVASAREVLVRVHASALNRADLLQREGKYPAPPGAPQDIPGMELAGEVAMCGPGVTRWLDGDRVMGIVAGGAQAEYAVVHEDSLTRVPSTLDWTSAGAVPEVFVTAYDALISQAAMVPGDFVLIDGVGSGVGLAAVQLVRAFGGMPFGTARTPAKIDVARAHGLEDGLVVSDSLDALRPRVGEWTKGHGIDVALDLIGGPYVAECVAVAARRGRIMLIGTIAGRQATIASGDMLGKRITMRGTVLRGRSVEEKGEVMRAFERDVVPLFETGQLAPNIDSVFALDDIAKAHERLASNATAGKVVIAV